MLWDKTCKIIIPCWEYNLHKTKSLRLSAKVKTKSLRLSAKVKTKSLRLSAKVKTMMTVKDKRQVYPYLLSVSGTLSVYMQLLKRKLQGFEFLFQKRSTISFWGCP